MTERSASQGWEPRKLERPEPVRRLGDPFFDALVTPYSPSVVRRTLYELVHAQYAEADRINKLRGWGGAQPHGNDRYQFSLEQAQILKKRLPGAEFQRPSGSLLYSIGHALVYPMRYATNASECPTSARIDEESDIQLDLAEGRFYEPPTLFDPEPSTPRKVVWLLFTGNHVESGPLSAYVAMPSGTVSDRWIEWSAIEPLIEDDQGDELMEQEPDPDSLSTPLSTQLPPEPSLPISLRP